MIQQNSVVTMSYVLRDEDRIILDASIGQPFMFLQGHQNIIPGLEKALMGLKPGDRKSVTIPPEEGYGKPDPNLKITLPKEQFGKDTPEPGMQVQLNSPQGQPFMATIVEVTGNQIVLDANHPLAGKTLFFEVDIFDVRSASAEELAHGHPHDPNNPHHHH